jgi:hypothetical protein
LGRAIFAFARLEWDAVWCCNIIEADYIDKLLKKTAGVIADDLVRLVSSQKLLWDSYGTACEEFKRLVVLRNELFHGKPGTTPDGLQRVFNRGSVWTIELVNNAADEFTACEIRLNDLLYKGLNHS